MVSLAFAPLVARDPCVGDCNENDAIDVTELIRGVNILLDRVEIDSCPLFDGGGSEGVTVDELIRAVIAALNGC
jgi:hypothetical protein